MPLLEFTQGQSFGELSLLNHQPRAGTVLTLTDCFFAVIGAEGYERLLKKDIALKMTANVKFLRQIPYMQNWLMKETQRLLYYCEEKKSTKRG